MTLQSMTSMFAQFEAMLSIHQFYISSHVFESRGGSVSFDFGYVIKLVYVLPTFLKTRFQGMRVAS